MDSQPRRFEEWLTREILLILGMVLVALIQVSLLPTPLGLTPQIMVILIVSRIIIGTTAIQPDSALSVALRWAFYGGLALDLVSATPFGSHALALLLASLVIVLITSRIHVDGFILPLLAVALSLLLYEVVLALIYTLTVASIDWLIYMQVIVLPSILITLIPTLPLFLSMRWVWSRVVKDI